MKAAAGPRVSVVIAAYNAAGPLSLLLGSLACSRFRDFEVCLCDDGSTDRTREIARSFAGRLDVRLTVHPENRGVTAARNSALGLARAPLLFFLDADVRLAPESLERFLAALERTGADVVAGVYSDRALDPGLFSSYYALFSHHSFLQCGRLSRYNVFHAGCALCRRAALDAVGGHLEVPKGVEVENESLGRRLVARGYVISLDPALAVDHHWGGWRKLAFRLTSRVYWWVKVFFASDRRFEAALTTRGYALGTAALPAAVLALLLGRAGPASGAAAGAGLAVFLWTYASFFAFVARRRGPLFVLWSVLLSAASSFLVTASAAYSVAEELALLLRHGRTTLDREALAR
jgi:glycosyltransferase involved in cell wall biosynthesis